MLQTMNEFIIILLLTKNKKKTYWLLLNAPAQFISRHFYINKTVRFDKSFEIMLKVQAQSFFTSRKNHRSFTHMLIPVSKYALWASEFLISRLKIIV